ncbi:DUF2690 domain-containing protein [Streptomyces sp. NRRL B-3648]|uniref:DUF2690 domain-containing protein n=1 Tax=Streptomyces sp. NRRL B-3648 TaxID=1519493 RepID=UPI0006AFF23A|nr:DUF2690 domain-containing protein [Streptomyces sp. NRRL B-3648]KOV96075.1 hypothetical protein ADL04_17900 [Streptomyces sp. NRRL B-3648]
MAVWKPLPHALDADVRNLIDQLRACKDRSGLTLSSLAERTQHSKSSWERYLNGKAFPPQQAVTSLGRLAGADETRLAALWELADRAWSGRHASEPRSATPPGTPVRPAEQPATTGSEALPSHTLASPAPPQPSAGTAQGPPRRGPRLRPAALTRLRPRAARWGVLLVPVASLAALAVAAVVIRWDPASQSSPGAVARHTTITSTEPGALETRCFEDSCRGQDPRVMGCAGDAWTAALTRVHGVYVELRYSDSCKAAWARISWGAPGDIAKVVADSGTSYQEHVHYDTDVYSPMVASDASSAARACAVLTSGAHGCTGPGGPVHLTEPPEPVNSPSVSVS